MNHSLSADQVLAKIRDVHTLVSDIFQTQAKRIAEVERERNEAQAHLRGLLSGERSFVEPKTRLIKAAKALADAMPSGQGLRSFHAGRQVVDPRDAIEAAQLAPETSRHESLSASNGGEKSGSLSSDNPGVTEARSNEGGIVREVPGESIQSREPVVGNTNSEARASAEQFEAKRVDPSQPSSPETTACQHCGGQGWTAQPDPRGGDARQVQCEPCLGTGQSQPETGASRE